MSLTTLRTVNRLSFQTIWINFELLKQIWRYFFVGSLVWSSFTLDASDRSKYITWYHASDFEIEQTDSEISGIYIGQYAVKRYLCLQNGTKSRDYNSIENLFSVLSRNCSSYPQRNTEYLQQAWIPVIYLHFELSYFHTRKTKTNWFIRPFSRPRKVLKIDLFESLEGLRFKVDGPKGWKWTVLR